MNVFIVIILICEAHGFFEPRSDLSNVGTVLFTTSDLYKKRWNRNKIKLLQARKYLQPVIPSPHLSDTVNEEYLTSLLSYFKESFRTLKREVRDPEVNDVMNLALSDAFGGFLKVWVLPITKYAFYSGTVSMEKAIYMFQVYEGIKHRLNTDGRSWRSPNENLLKTVAIDVMSRPKPPCSRSMKNPCKHLAYYEKTDTELTVPLPVINWDILPITIFVPLKNQSLVPISSANSSKILFHYYDIAENCMQAQNPESVNDFNKKFQTWLSKDVAPHLKDDNLYLAFGSILSLINNSNSLSEIVCNTCHKKYQNLKTKVKSFKGTLCNSTKKYLILTLIILLEVIWCLPSCFYIMRLRKRKRKGSIKNYFFRFFQRKSKNNTSKLSKNKSKLSKLFKCTYKTESDYSNKQDQGVKLFVKPRTRNLEVDIQHPSCDSKYMSIKSSKSYINSSSNDYIAFVSGNSLKPSLKKILPEFDSSFLTPDVNNQCTNNNNNTKARNSRSLKQINLEPTKTLTFVQDEKTIKEINYSQESSMGKLNNEQSNSKLQCKCSLRAANSKPNLSSQCPCSPCLKNDFQLTENKDKKIHDIFRNKFDKYKKNLKKEHQTVLQTEVAKTLHIPENIKKQTKITTNTDEIKLGDFNKPLLRIRIDRPKTEIKVGISTLKERSNVNRSKIPRLAKLETNALTRVKENNNLTKTPQKENFNNMMLGKNNVAKSVLDDTALKRNTTLNKKLNITL